MLRALGLMSGTSMDGVDAALVETDGETIHAFGPSIEVAPAYHADQRAVLECASEIAMAALETGERPDASSMAGAAQGVDAIHLAAVTMLEARCGPADLIGYHGQTVAHAPHRGLTLQLGDGTWLARRTGRRVVWDFRSADMVAGGEGAPLAPFFHHALARHIGADAPLCFLNIGGVANVTWVDPRLASPEDAGALLAFDTGPGNALIDDLMAARTGAQMDAGGAAALAGEVREVLGGLNSAMAYLARTPPKSLDRNAFQAAGHRVAALSTEDGAATLTDFTARCVAEAATHLPSPPVRWLVCGGGRHNPAMMARLSVRLDAPVEAVEAVGLDGDMLEAQAFAYLAVRALRGLPLSAPGTTGARDAVSGGRISDP